jgi:glycosyltransferase involved in cell wall biosynthesis
LSAASSRRVTVVVASHARHLRLRWLLNALEDQTLERGLWEVVVVHDYDGAVAERVIARHPLAEDGTLRSIAIAPGTGSPSLQRNLGWRDARTALVAFTDDDCRPDPGWLEALLEASTRAPGAVVQGRVRPDHLEEAVLLGPHVRTLHVDPVNPYAQTANILYPRDLLERLGGFDEVSVTGEDVELALRARAAGARFVPAHDALVHHAVESHALPGILRQNLKWRHLGNLVKRHPEFRRELRFGVFWNVDHLVVTVAVAGLLGARRRRRWMALAVPYAARAAGRRGRGPKARAIALAELPGGAVREAGEVAVMAAGSVVHRTLVL